MGDGNTFTVSVNAPGDASASTTDSVAGGVELAVSISLEVVATAGVLLCDAISVGVSVGKSSARGVAVGTGKTFCVCEGGGVTVGKETAGGRFSPITPALRIVKVAVGVAAAVTVVSSTIRLEVVVVSEMATLARVGIAVSPGVVVAVTVMVSTPEESSMTGPNRASGEMIGGGGTTN
jgi:hypothetical protein